MYLDSEQIEQIEDRISQLEKSIELLLANSNICTHPLNNEFKIQYRKWFDKSKGDPIVNITEFIDDPPREIWYNFDEKGQEYKDHIFWSWFEETYLKN
jgi:hypothetical protein